MRLSRWKWSLLGALLVGLLARVPGIFWGANYPTGWMSHHIDEYTHLVNALCLISPATNSCSSYPRGMAVHAALPVMAARALSGTLYGSRSGSLPATATVITVGRVESVLYGVATILVLFLLARLFFPERPGVPLLAAWIFALGGLHVTQSHFFLADVPTLFWTVLSLYLLAKELEQADPGHSPYLHFAAFCTGVAFGLKLTLLVLPSLLAIALLRRPRVLRLAYSAVFLAAGFYLVNLGTYSPYDLYKTMRSFSNEGLGVYHFSRLAGAGIYFLELPSIASLPITLLAGYGILLLLRKMIAGPTTHRVRLVFVVMLPLLTTAWAVFFKLDNFPRHLLLFFPWIAIAGAVGLQELGEFAAGRHIHRAWVVAPVFVYLALFVIDGERFFWKEPRNDAANWLLAHVPKGSTVSWYASWWGRRPPLVPGYVYTRYPAGPQPDVIVAEMHFLNPFLSGMGWRDSYPRNYTSVFSAISQEQLDAWQNLFRGTSSYTECARFSESYFMPEYVLTDRWLGNRSRNYIAEVVIFKASPLNARGR